MSWQLVAHPEDDIADIATLSVQRALRQLKATASVASVNNIAAAEEVLQAQDASKLDLIIVAATMPADDTSSVGSSTREATKLFVKQLKLKYPLLQVIVVATTPDEALANFIDAYFLTGMVTLGSEFGASLVQRVCALRASALELERAAASSGEETASLPDRPIRADAWLHLDIYFSDRQFGGWTISRVGSDEFQQRGTMQFDKDQLERIIADSRDLDDSVARNDVNWLKRLERLSTDLRKLLFSSGVDNFRFWTHFLTQRERVGGVGRSRIRVTVDDRTYAMLFEALRDTGDEEDEYWVLNAPVFRRYEQQLVLPPLFKEKDAASRDKPINALIIEADAAPGFIGDEKFARLEYLTKEADEVEKILRAHAGGKVERLSLGSLGGLGGDVRQVLLDKLAEEAWHVVHFCGHVGGTPEQAGLVLRARADGMLPIASLAGALRRTQLLFLSSCRSASTRVVMHAVERHVSAVVGFQWVIDDGAACQFAIDFYGQLFNSTDPRARDLEYALLQARRKVYKAHPEQPSWVAPVLVMQMG